MLRLYITRHAKASKDDPTVRDFDRPLNERGLRDAASMGARFKQRDEPVDVLLSSPAKRAHTTAAHFADALGIAPADVVLDKDLYLADTGMLLRALGRLPGHARSAMVFGHNPGLSELVNALTDGPFEELATCSTVRVDLPAEAWSAITRGTGTLAWSDRPGLHTQ